MTRSEFAALPVAMQVRLILQAFPQVEDRILGMDVPKLPLAPKFDSRIRRKDGYQWASETDIEGLRYYYGRATSGGGDESFAEKNAKEARGLEFWIRWREMYPTQIWEGERNRAPSVALAPASKPTVHQWEARPGTASTNGGQKPNSQINTRALDGEEDEADDQPLEM